MMRLALQARGYARSDNPHYDLTAAGLESRAPDPTQGATAPERSSGTQNHVEHEQGDGVYL
jgi:hypothetical protein